MNDVLAILLVDGSVDYTMIYWNFVERKKCL